MAVVGPFADNAATTQGQLYGGQAPFVVTPRAALANLTRVVYLNGSGVADDNTSGIPAAAAAARPATQTEI